MDAPEVARLTQTQLYGSLSTANIAKGWGLSDSQINIFEDQQPIQIGLFRVTPILTKHYEFPNAAMRERALEGTQVIEEPLVPPANVFAYKMGGAYSLYIEHPKGNMLIHGSAGFVEDGFKDLRPNVVFLGIAGLAKQTADYQSQFFEELLDKTQAKVIYPIHFDAFSGSIRLPIQGPTYLNDFMMDSKGSLNQTLDAVSDREGSYLYLLPQWDKIAVFPGY